MGLQSIRVLIIKKLKEGRIQNETTRSGRIDEKNLLLTGRVSVEEVIELINSTKGNGIQLRSTI